MFDKVQELKDNFKGYARNKKALYILMLILFAVLSFLFVAFLVGKFMQGFDNLFHENNKSALDYGLGSGFIVSLIIYGLLAVILFIMTSSGNHKNVANNNDRRGVSYMQKGTFGTAKFMNNQEAKKVFNIAEVLDTKETIYGQITQNGEQVVSYKPKREGQIDEERNVLVIGRPGLAKSWSYVRPELIQIALRGDSVICNDPSGELYRDMSQFYRDKGYDTKLFNLKNPEWSDFWNCLGEVIDKNTERIDGIRLTEFCKIYVVNSTEGVDEVYWRDCAENLLGALIGYTSWVRESKILAGYQSLFVKVCSGHSGYENILLKMNETVSFKWCKNQILSVAKENGYDENTVKKLIQQIEDCAPKLNLSNLYKNMLNFMDLEANHVFDTLPEEHIGRNKYITYNTSKNENVRTQALQGLQMKFSIFADKKLRDALSYDGIDLQNMNLKKTAIFLKTSDSSTATRGVASLFFSFAFKDIMEEYDIQADKVEADAFNGIETVNPCLPVSVILDEFFSLGVVCGTPLQFVTIMQNSRKRLIHTNIIVQSLTNLPEIYGENNAHAILDCLSVTLFLGTRDTETANYVSEYLCGTSTVLTESHQEANGLLSMGVKNELGIQSSSRYLLTPDEVLKWESQGKILVSKAGYNPLAINFFGWKEHPYFKRGFIKRSSISTTIVPISERLAQMELLADSDTEIHNNINNLLSEVEVAYPVVDKPIEPRTQTAILQPSLFENVQFPEPVSVKPTTVKTKRRAVSTKNKSSLKKD